MFMMPAGIFKESKIKEPSPPPRLYVAKLDPKNRAYDNAILLAKSGEINRKIIGRLTSRDQSFVCYYPIVFDEKITDPYQVQMSGPMRSQFFLSDINRDEPNLVLVDADKLFSNTISTIHFEIVVVLPSSSSIEKIDPAVLGTIIKEKFLNYPFYPNQLLTLSLGDKGIIFKVGSVNEKKSSGLPEKFLLNTESKIEFSSKTDKIVVCDETRLPKKLTLDFGAKGIGGHKKELAKLLREGFFSRALPPSYAKSYGTKHTKGILLYGPPGTGKTLIAREISNCFTKNKVKIINGPELKNKFIGQSQENLRNVFKDATLEWQQKGEESDLHIVIFDEIDALCPERGSRVNSTGVDDEMVNQLLTILDGVDSPQNILVIGMTNRKDLIDPAVLRPGRLEVHIEINLPDENGRLEILNIKTQTMKQAGLLDEDVNLAEFAKKTENWTGAELESLVKQATHYALGGNFDPAQSDALVLKKEITDETYLEKVNKRHFDKAFLEIKPAFGVDKKFEQLKITNFALYDEKLKQIISNFEELVTQFKPSPDIHHLQFLFCGERGVGKTSLATYLAELSGAKCIKMLTPEMLLGLSIEKQLSLIEDTFLDVARADFSVLILDDLENLVGADADLQGYSNSLRLKFQSMLKNPPNTTNKCIIIATGTCKAFLARLKLDFLFQESAELKKVDLHYGAEETLSFICDALGYSYTTSFPRTLDIEISIRDLVYQLQKSIVSDRSVDVTQFCAALYPHISTSNSLTARSLGVLQEKM